MLKGVELVLPSWSKVHRLVPSHFPPINLFEEVLDADELELAYAIESLTNDRLRQEIGELNLVPKEQRITGPGASPIMAAFTHIGYPSRFASGQHYGVYYGAKALNTAIKETIHHREKLMRMTDEPDTELTMRCYVNKVCLQLHDIRGDAYAHLHTDDYTLSQTFANMMRNNGSHGLLYNSVRDPGGECIAAFNPRALTIPVQTEHYQYQWRHNDNKIVSVLRLSLVDI
jgi:hypothetical protein